MARRIVWSSLLSVSLALALVPALADTTLEPELLAGLKARSIGPAGMSGRVAAIEAVVSNPDIVFVGAATGGLWRSDNGGLTWRSLFDEQPVAAVGAVAVFQPNPDIVWVGTGEGSPRNSVSVGNGVYRSLDGGETWTHLGLERSERIHRILLHPTDPRTAWVGALGPAWGEGGERGVYRTTDGGKTWTQVLAGDNGTTGVGDLVMDPSNPQRLLAALWDYRRWPWLFRSGGPGSGLYLSVDGGESWRRLGEEDGLPKGELGRIGLAFCLGHPETTYAIVEAETSALLRSGDGGKTWVRVNQEHDIANRPFYYADIRVDPEWPQRVYNLASRLSVSDDGGKSFGALTRWREVHPDYHALWINPLDPEHLIVGNDGGVFVSRDRGATWRFASNLPLAQYYHVAVDTDMPYHVYGGLQDNGSWRGPSTVWENGGIRNHHWEEVGFGDGFDTRPDPEDSLQGYGMSQQGYLFHWDLRTGGRKDIRPPAPEEARLRFSWNAALAQDPFEPATIYFGSQYVHRSIDRGQSWEIISPDLTTNDPEHQQQAESGGLTLDVTGAENFTTIITLAPSPVERGVLWAGTDDGRIQVTRDGGETWTSVEAKLTGVPQGTWVPHIEASPFHAGTAFVVLDNHRRSDWTPYLFRTDDYGAHWKSLASDDLRGYAHAIVQDFENPELLFLGTEFGLWVSLDGGGSWMRWTHGFPTVAVRDLVVHPTESDLVIGTHGRAAFVLDDIRPLRSLSPELLAEPVHVFDPPDAILYTVKQTGASRFPGHGEFRGATRPHGALLTFSLAERALAEHAPADRELPSPDEFEKRREAKGRERAAAAQQAVRRPEGRKRGGPDEKGPQATIRIFDAEGEVVRTFREPVHRGVNRVTWNLRRDPFREPPREREWWRDEPSGAEVLPGSYTVVVAFGEKEARASLEILPDPRESIGPEERSAKWEAIRRAGMLQEGLAKALTRVVSLHSDVELVLRLRRRAAEAEAPPADDDEKPETDPLTKEARSLERRLGEIERALWVPPKTKGIVSREKVALSRVGYAMRSLRSSRDAPTPAQLAYLAEAEAMAEAAVEELNAFLAGPVAEFRRQVREEGLELLPEGKPVELPTAGAGPS